MNPLLLVLLSASLALAQSTDWTNYGLTPEETRYSPLAQINDKNAGQLKLAWSYDIGKGGGTQEATPLVWNKTLFSITNWSIVYALDAATGKEKWRWDPEVNQDTVRSKVCCGVANRGMVVYQGLIIAPIIDGRLVALDAETGKPKWEARVSWPQDNYTVTMAPRIAKNKVIIGVAGAEFPTRGYFDAYDAKTGERSWRFYTVPGDPSKPFENPALKEAAKTWAGDFWKLQGGGSVWDGMAYDPEADLLYVGTGNGGPWPEELRKSKGLANLYLCSVVAVKPDTGELKWYFQMVPGDSWDFDSVQQLLLADLTIKGQKRKVLMQANKNGFFYVLDRLSGQFISGKPFAKVTWAAGLDEKSGKPFVNKEAYYGDQLIEISPSTGGAHNWPPMSFNPSTGLVYIPGAIGSSSTFAIDRDFVYKPGENNRGIRRGAPTTPGGPGANLPAVLPPPPAIGPEIGPDTPRNVLVAWDPVNQVERWRRTGGGAVGGGTLTTAGNLVFQVIPDGHLVAYTADKGEKVLDIDTGLRGGMGPPMTFQLDGKQYISLAGGTGVVVGPAYPPNTPLPAPTANTVFPKLLTYVLEAR